MQTCYNLGIVVCNEDCDRSVQGGMVVLRRVQHAKIQTGVEVTLYFLLVSIYLTERVQLTNRLINTSPCFPRGRSTHKPYKDVYHYVCVCVWWEYGAQAESQVTLALCPISINAQLI